MRKSRTFFLLGVLCLVAASAAEAAAQQVVQGQVIGIGGRRAGLNRPFRLTVNNYSSPDDVVQLNQALRSGGQEELLRALSRLNAGRVAIGNNVGVRANAIIATPQAEGGTKLTVLYVRDVAIFELRYGTRSADYRFGYAEIYLDSRGRGEGTIIPSAKVKLEGDNTWVVEDFAEFPARLMGLRSTGRVGPAR
ncbi:MAG TPA: hypothetical protein VN282_22245 [Pyrinomonadaceae bacterium]|nr:hypothetical protein [Pyrinomonadaceae bacterium]